MNERPDYCTDEMLDYLDDLRASGQTNMFGAGPYVAGAFDLNAREAREVCLYWMHTFPRKTETGTESTTGKAV